jgi:hypothetical protein
MASKFDAYKASKAQLASAEEWLSMIGKPQPRTTARADGFLSSVTLAAVVHFQYSDGATNYHDVPATLKHALSAAAKANFSNLAEEAIAAMRSEVETLRKQAADEYRALLEDDGEVA